MIKYRTTLNMTFCFIGLILISLLITSCGASGNYGASGDAGRSHASDDIKRSDSRGIHAVNSEEDSGLVP